MDSKAIRRRCEARLATLILPQPFDLAAFCAQVADQRGHPIVLRAMSFAGIAYGVCLSTLQADYILYEQDTSPFHQQHIILHEVSHLICGHHGTDIASVINPGGLFDDVNLGRLEAVMQRASYSAAEEREAELLATLLEQRVSRPSSHQSTPLSDRLTASLADGSPHLGAKREGRT